MVAPTTSYPASTNRAAATDESTPPDIATRTRSLTVPPRPKSERGTRSAEQPTRVRSPEPATQLDDRSFCSAFRVPRSSLRSSVQDGGQGPDLLDNLRQSSDDSINVLQRVLLAEREPQRRDAQLPRHAHRRQHVRRLDRAGRAGGAGRAGDPREVEVHEQRLAVGTGNRHAR